MQYSQEDVEQYFKDHGCVLLSKYVNVKTPLDYIAQCGHEARVCSYEAARRPSCSFLCQACSPKVSYSREETERIVERKGCTLLDVWNERSSNGRIHKTIKIVCTCGHEHTLTFEKFQQGRGILCPKCARPRGAKHHAYNPSLTDEDRLRNRDLYDVIVWRRAVFTRDNFTCQICNDSAGGNLTAHHLNGWSDYPAQRFDVNNGITLCEDCHKKFHSKHGYGHNNVQQFIDWCKRDNTEVMQETKESCTP